MSDHDGTKPAELRRLVNRLAHEVGFDLVAVTDAADFDADRELAMRRIDDGLMDGLPWFTKARMARGTSPDGLLPGARSIISLGLNYYPGTSDTASEGSGLVARYAQGRDYHRVMKRRMRRLVIALSEHPALQQADQELKARWYVDDGPMLDRAAASRAGLGWFGKNGNILNPTYGSWLLLGQIVTNLELEPDAPLAKTCGQCARCIPACPTDAIVAPYVVDNRRCISYLTIEHKGAIPRDLRPGMGTWVFGCDICQEVCPVNRKAKATSDPNFGRRDLTALDLVEFAGYGRAAVSPALCRHAPDAGQTGWDAAERLRGVGQSRRCDGNAGVGASPGIGGFPGAAARGMGLGAYWRSRGYRRPEICQRRRT